MTNSIVSQPTNQHNPTNNKIKFISSLSAWLVAVIALGSLALSYNALQAVAVANGITGWRSLVWPGLIDVSLVVFSLAVVRNYLRGERTRWPWFLVFVYTAATVGFNLVHSPQNVTAWLTAVVAPLSLFLSFETLMSMLKSDVVRQSTIIAISDLETEAVKLTDKLEALSIRHEQTKKDVDFWDKLNSWGSKTVKKDSPQWDELRELVWQRDKKHCVICRKSLSSGHYHCHHVRPKAKGGRDTPVNLVTLCDHCHDAIHDNELFVTGPGSLTMAHQAKKAKIESRRADVMEMLRAGQQAGDIADSLDVSLKTIQRDIKSLNGQAVSK